MSKNDDYTTGNLLSYECFSNPYKLIATDFRNQIELQNNKQQIDFIDELEEDNGASMFSIRRRDRRDNF